MTCCYSQSLGIARCDADSDCTVVVHSTVTYNLDNKITQTIVVAYSSEIGFELLRQSGLYATDRLPVYPSASESVQPVLKGTVRARRARLRNTEGSPATWNLRMASHPVRLSGDRPSSSHGDERMKAPSRDKFWFLVSAAHCHNTAQVLQEQAPFPASRNRYSSRPSLVSLRGWQWTTKNRLSTVLQALQVPSKHNNSQRCQLLLKLRFNLDVRASMDA